MQHCEFTDIESLKDPFVKKVFKAIKEVYSKEGVICIEKIFYALPPETRRKDLNKIVELML